MNKKNFVFSFLFFLTSFNLIAMHELLDAGWIRLPQPIFVDGRSISNIERSVYPDITILWAKYGNYDIKLAVIKKTDGSIEGIRKPNPVTSENLTTDEAQQYFSLLTNYYMQHAGLLAGQS